jgi:5-methyltetrahydrofolate--homocysteine methyltransferase
LTAVAKKLRRNATVGEQLLWFHLRNRKVDGHKFKRQHPIGRYVVDFVCTDKKLVIEVDGSTHLSEEAINRDRNRQKWLEENGYVVMRFWGDEVKNDIMSVLERIRVKSSILPSHNPSLAREGSNEAD